MLTRNNRTLEWQSAENNCEKAVIIHGSSCRRIVVKRTAIDQKIMVEKWFMQGLSPNTILKNLKRDYRSYVNTTNHYSQGEGQCTTSLKEG